MGSLLVYIFLGLGFVYDKYMFKGVNIFKILVYSIEIKYFFKEMVN